MKSLDRNISILEHIVDYCGQIEETILRFGNSYQAFCEDKIYRNAAAMCVLQIGELAGKLTDAFRAEHPGVRSGACAISLLTAMVLWIPR